MYQNASLRHEINVFYIIAPSSFSLTTAAASVGIKYNVFTIHPVTVLFRPKIPPANRHLFMRFHRILLKYQSNIDLRHTSAIFDPYQPRKRSRCHPVTGLKCISIPPSHVIFRSNIPHTRTKLHFVGEHLNCAKLATHRRCPAIVFG